MFDDLFKSMPGMEDAAKKHGANLQVKMFEFLSKSMSGKRRFVHCEYVNVVAATAYLNLHKDHILTWSITPDLERRTVWLVTEEMTDG